MSARRASACMALVEFILGASAMACDPKPENTVSAAISQPHAAPRRVPAAVVAADLASATLVFADVTALGETTIDVAGRRAFERRFVVTNARAATGGVVPASFELTAVSLIDSVDRLNIQLPATSLDGWDFVDLALGDRPHRCALFVGGPAMSAPRGLGGRTPRVAGHGERAGEPVRALVATEPELEVVLPALVAMGREPSPEALDPWLMRHPIVALDALRRAVRRPIEPEAATSVARLFSISLDQAQAPAVKLAALELAERALGMSEAESNVGRTLVEALLRSWMAEPPGVNDEPWLALWNEAHQHLVAGPTRTTFEAELARRALDQDLEPLLKQIGISLSSP